MGLSQRLKRKHRRNYKRSTWVRHKLRGGRTGSVHHKKRKGMLIEIRKRRGVGKGESPILEGGISESRGA